MDKTIGTLVINIEARLNKLEAGLKKAETDGERAATKISSAFKNTLGLLGAGLGASQLFSFFQKAIDSFAQEEAAQKKLEVALGKTNKSLLEQASALQKTTTFADDQIVTAQALIAAFTKDESQIKSLTSATLDLAEAKGMDLTSAADLVAESFGSSTNALSRYGIEVDASAGSTERMRQIVDGITKLYGGQATNAVNTHAGRVKQLQNTVGDLEEAIGRDLTNALTQSALDLNRFTQEIIDLNDKLLDTTSGGLMTMLINDIMLATGNASGLADQLSGVNNEIRKAIEEAIELKKLQQENIGKYGNQMTGNFTAYKTTKFVGETSATRKEIKDQIKVLQEELDNLVPKSTAYVNKQNEILKLQKLITEETEKTVQQISKVGDATDIESRKRRSVPDFDAFVRPTENDKSNFTMSPIEMPDGPGVDEQIEEDFRNMADSVQTYSNIASNAFSSFTDLLQIKSSSSASAVEKAFTSMVNSILQELARLAVSSLFTKLFTGIATGGASLALPGVGLFGHHGGTFQNGKKIASFAGGGEFTVPAGYGNDSFPMMVESFERVKVTPSSQVGQSEKLLATIVGEMRALVNITASKESSVTVVNNSPDVRTKVKRDGKVQSTMIREGNNLSER